MALSIVLALGKSALAFDIVKDGQPQTAIVIPNEPSPVVAYAAQELAYHIAQATGAVLPIVKEDQKPQQFSEFIYLGPCQETQQAGLDAQKLPPNAFIIKTAGPNLFLTGNDSDGRVLGVLQNNWTRVGTLFAVYEFLEKHLGVRWLWPGTLGEVIPKTSNIAVVKWDQTGFPLVHTRFRDSSYSGRTAGWSSPQARVKYLNDQTVWLRRQRFATGVNMDAGHSFTDYWDRFSKTHPEYFNLLPDGTRRSDPYYERGASSLISMSVAEPSLWRQIVENWSVNRTMARLGISISENDTAGKCTCEKCLAWDVPDPDNKTPFEERLKFAREAFLKGESGWENHLGSLSDRYAKFFLAVQKEAEKIDPNVIVTALAYTNYCKPPLKTKLNNRVLIALVPSFMYPWTAEKRELFRIQWSGWANSGVSLMLRPNYMLDGHNLPIFFARKLGEDLSFAGKHGLVATDFDSLTGQWATQGPNLYVLARIQSHPDLPVDKVLDEYYQGFGKAASAVKAYFEYWEKISDAVNDEESLDLNAQFTQWSRFYLAAGRIFTPQVMAAGRRLLEEAQKAAKGDVISERRVDFLKKGLDNAELTLKVQSAYKEYKKSGKMQNYRQAMAELDTLRESVENDNIANMGFLAWAEGRNWDRSILAFTKQPGEILLPSPWKFMWDPKKNGANAGWQEEKFNDSQWFDIQIGAPYEDQEVGKKWKAEHGSDYLGFSWYRATFVVKPSSVPEQVRLVFGAVDEACTVWVNGRQVLERPYPYRGDPDSWAMPFEVDITDAAHYDQPNTLAVRVENNAGAGGIWKPVWLVQAKVLAPQENNAVRNPGFEEKTTDLDYWHPILNIGKCELGIDRTESQSGKASARITCIEVAPEAKPDTLWARWFQPNIPVKPGTTYRLRLWVKTSTDFTGAVVVFFRSGESGKGLSAATKNAQFPPTEGLWKEMVVEGIVPATDKAALYLNAMNGTGTVWFDDVELTEVKQ
ncbi:MAG: DUF4838 domain-containing protein [Candidatus Omnitrophota bacterium]